MSGGMRSCANLWRRALRSSAAGAIHAQRLPPPPIPNNHLPTFRPSSFSFTSSAAFTWPPRTFSSLPSGSGSSSVCPIQSEEQFNGALAKIREESSPAILYFTAVWCGPCKLMSPAIEALGEKYPHVTTYKIDIDLEELQDKLMEMRINSVPTLLFFQNGKKVDEIVGADIKRLDSTMERLYK